MKTLDVNNLVNSLEKVKVINSPFKRSIKWFGISFVLMTLLTFVLYCFKECSMNTYPLSFYFESLALVLVSYLSIFAAFLYSSPDETYQRYAKTLSITSIAIWTSLFAYCIYHCLTQGHAGHILHELSNAVINITEIFNILFIGLLPTLWLILMLKKAFPTNKRITGLLVILGSLTLAMVFSRFLSENIEASHMLVWKYSPLLILSIISFLLGNKLLSK